jgi:DNA-binding transcriptional regulator YiaG
MNMLNAIDIKAIREANNWTQAQLAAELTVRGLTVTEAAVRRWEDGSRHPRWRTMEALNAIVKGSKLAAKVDADAS